MNPFNDASRINDAARLILAIGLAGCMTMVRAEQSTSDSVKKVTYEDDIKPIFRQHCLNCHSQGDSKGGLALDTYTGLVEGGGSGEVVYDDGEVEGSRLWQLVSHEDTPIMPPNQDRIPDSQLELIRSWLEGGILENSGSKAKAKKKNALAYVATTGGRPDGPVAMPETVPFEAVIRPGRPAAATAIACSPWAPLVAVAGQQQILLYHTDLGEFLGVLPFAEGEAQSLRFSRDGNYLVAGGGQHSVLGIVAIYDVKTGQRLATVGDELDTVLGCDVDATMTRVAMGGPKRMLRIHDVNDGSVVFSLKKHTDWILDVAYSPDGVLLASSDRSGGLVVWEADTGRQYLDLGGHKGAVHAIAWRDDSNVLASASDDGTVKLWDMFSGKQIKSINAHGGGVTAVQFDHQGRLLTAGKNRRVTLWDASGKKIRDFAGLPEPVLEASISHDGNRIIAGDWSGQIAGYNTEESKLSLTLSSIPPSDEDLLKEVREDLKSISSMLAEKSGKLTQLTASLDGLQRQLSELKASAQAAKNSATAARMKLADAKESMQSFAKAIDNLTGHTRDLHDRVIATRLGNESADAEPGRIADAEKLLADSLLELVAKRRGLSDARQTIAKQSKLVDKHDQDAASANAQLGKLRPQHREAKEQFDSIEKLVNELTQQRDRLLDRERQLQPAS